MSPRQIGKLLTHFGDRCASKRVLRPLQVPFDTTFDRLSIFDFPRNLYNAHCNGQMGDLGYLQVDDSTTVGGRELKHFKLIECFSKSFATQISQFSTKKWFQLTVPSYRREIQYRTYFTYHLPDTVVNERISWWADCFVFQIAISSHVVTILTLLVS